MQECLGSYGIQATITTVSNSQADAGIAFILQVITNMLCTSNTIADPRALVSFAPNKNCKQFDGLRMQTTLKA